MNQAMMTMTYVFIVILGLISILDFPRKIWDTGYMPIKSREERNRVQRLWYHRNKEARLIQIKSRVSWIRRYVSQYKEDNPTCLDCGIEYPPYILDFDHLPEFEKSFPLSSSGVKGRGLDAVNAEIAKCEIVCANCHRHRTFMRNAEKRNP